MIRAGLLALVLAGPAGAEDLCPAVWGRVTEALSGLAALSGEARQDGDWCVIDRVILDLEGQYVPDWHMDRLRLRGGALGWLVQGTAAPDSLEIGMEGLRLVFQTGRPQLDWLYAAQARANKIEVEASLAWDAGTKVLRLEGLSIDFPGDDLVELSAAARGVDLSSTGAMQMSLSGFALTEADLSVTTHGLFEAWMLMPLGPFVLPEEGDMDAAVKKAQADAIFAVAGLPEAFLPAASKAALAALIGDLPNPAGQLTVALRSEAGIGPARMAPWAMNGVPETLAEAAGALEGVTVEVGWTPEDDR